jgi:hypothetical protein
MARKPLVIWGDLTDEDLQVIRTELDSRALALLPVVPDAERARAIRRRFGR